MSWIPIYMGKCQKKKEVNTILWQMATIPVIHFWLLCVKAKKMYEEWNKVRLLEIERKVDFKSTLFLKTGWWLVMQCVKFYFSLCHKFLLMGMRWGFPPGMQAYSPDGTGAK